MLESSTIPTTSTASFGTDARLEDHRCFVARTGQISQLSFVFDQPPSDFAAKVEISSIFVQVGERLLFVKRHPQVSKGNTWAIPAGSVKSRTGETPEMAALRELREETQIQLDQLQFLQTVYIREPGLDYIYHMFAVELPELPQIRLNEKEATSHRWLTRAEADFLNEHNQLIIDEMPCVQRIFGNGTFGSVRFERHTLQLESPK